MANSEKAVPTQRMQPRLFHRSAQPDFLKTRDDATIRAIIAQGQSDLGMPPFGASYGGHLSDDEIDAIVAFIRSWEANPLVIEPTPLPTPTPTPGGLSAAGYLCQSLCSMSRCIW